MSYGKVSKVPIQVSFPKSFCSTLHGSGKVKYNSHNEEWQSIAICNFMPGTFKSQHTVCRTRNNWYNHPYTSNNCNCLQPPWNRAKYKMVRPYKGIKQYLSPIGQYTQAV